MHAENTQNLEVYVWILSGVLGFLITTGTIIVTALARSLSQKITTLIESQERLNVSNAIVIEQIKTLFAVKQETERRLNDHAERLRDIELNCKSKARCSTER